MERFGRGHWTTLGRLDQRRDSRSVVHRAVIDCVAIDRTPHAKMVEMRAQHKVLMLQLRVAALKQRNNIRSVDGGDHFVVVVARTVTQAETMAAHRHSSPVPAVHPAYAASQRTASWLKLRAALHSAARPPAD